MPDPGTGQGPHDRAPRPLALTQGQRRSVFALLARVARSLEHFETLTGASPAVPLTFTRVDGTPDAEVRDALLHVAGALAREANAVAEACDTPPVEVNVPAALAAEFTILWSDAADTGPDRLVGYGPLDPRTRAALLPRIDHLGRLCLLVAHVASGRVAAAAATEHIERILGTTEDNGR